MRSGRRSSGGAGGCALGGAPLAAAVRLAQYPGGPLVADAGRAVLGQESFDLRAAPGRDLVVVMRTARGMDVPVVRIGAAPVSVGFAPAGLVLRVGGRPVATLEAVPAEGWDEWVLRVPAAAITGERTRLEVSGRYASFAYWAYQ